MFVDLVAAARTMIRTRVHVPDSLDRHPFFRGSKLVEAAGIERVAMSLACGLSSGSEAAITSVAALRDRRKAASDPAGPDVLCNGCNELLRGHGSMRSAEEASIEPCACLLCC